MYTAKYEAIFLNTIVKHEELLISLLETILKIKIDEVKILNSKLIKDKMQSRNQNVDLLIKSNNKYINIEINTNSNKTVINRNILYAFKVALDVAEKGKYYKFTNETIQINFNFDINGNEVIEEYTLYDSKINKCLSDKFKIYHVNIDKAIKIYYNGNKKFIREYAPIIMLDLQLEELNKLSKESEIVKKYTKALEEVNEDSEVVKWISPEEDRRQYEEALREEAALEGLAKGVIQGIEQQNIEIAKNLLKENMDFEFIQKITNLSIKQIEKIKL